MPAAGHRPKPMPLAIAGLAVLAAAGCSRPDWTDPETSKGSRALPRPAGGKAIPTDPGPAPPHPAWVAPLIGRELRAVFPKDGVCVGNSDGVARLHTGSPRGARIVGWAWDYEQKAPAPRVVLVDAAGAIVGGGETGFPRPDVPRAIPSITSQTSGWEAVSSVTAGRVQAYGVIHDGAAVCPLAGVQF